jgi:hypothetical protein
VSDAQTRARPRIHTMLGRRSGWAGGGGAGVRDDATPTLRQRRVLRAHARCHRSPAAQVLVGAGGRGSAYVSTRAGWSERDTRPSTELPMLLLLLPPPPLAASSPCGSSLSPAAPLVSPRRPRKAHRFGTSPPTALLPPAAPAPPDLLPAGLAPSAACPACS